MKTTFTVVGLGMMMLSAALAGCTGAKDEPAPPAPTTSATTMAPPPPAPSAPAPPPKPLPGLAYNKTGAYTLEGAPSFPGFNITTGWTKLTVEYFLNATSSCYVIGNELPSGLGTGPAPAITIKPPVSSAFTFELPPGPGSCGTTPGASVKHEIASMANEIGAWTVTVTGRGQNLDLVLVVRGE